MLDLLNRRPSHQEVQAFRRAETADDVINAAVESRRLIPLYRIDFEAGGRQIIEDLPLGANIGFSVLTREKEEFRFLGIHYDLSYTALREGRLFMLGFRGQLSQGEEITSLRLVPMGKGYANALSTFLYLDIPQFLDTFVPNEGLPLELLQGKGMVNALYEAVTQPVRSFQKQLQMPNELDIDRMEAWGKLLKSHHKRLEPEARIAIANGLLWDIREIQAMPTPPTTSKAELKGLVDNLRNQVRQVVHS